MSSSFDDETWERSLFERRAALEAPRGAAPALDLDDVLARIDGRTARAGAVSVISVARVVTLANAFAAAAACLALVRGVPAETRDGATDHARDDSPNMTMIAPLSTDGASLLACVVGDVVRGESMCAASAPAASAASYDDPTLLSSSAPTSAEDLSCTDEVTCGVLGP